MKLLHTMIRVKDIEKTLRFYIELLNMKLDKKKRLDDCELYFLTDEEGQNQIELTYNSNHIEGSTLTHDQTQYIFETNTIGVENKNVKVDDIVETTNHFKCVDFVIENAKKTFRKK